MWTFLGDQLELMSPLGQQMVRYIILGLSFLGVIVVIIMLYGLIVLVARARSGADVKVFGISVTSNQDVADLRDQLRRLTNEFKALDEDSKQKSNVLKLLGAIHKEISDLLSGADSSQVEHSIYLLYAKVMGATKASLSFRRANLSRIAVLELVKGTTHLKIAHSTDFNQSDIHSKRWPLDSMEGKTYTTGKQHYEENATKDKDYESGNDYTYKSRACTPMHFGPNCVGVLSISAQDEASFSAEDLDIMKLFAQVLSVLYFANEYYTRTERFKQKGAQ